MMLWCTLMLLLMIRLLLLVPISLLLVLYCSTLSHHLLSFLHPSLIEVVLELLLMVKVLKELICLVSVDSLNQVEVVVLLDFKELSEMIMYLR